MSPERDCKPSRNTIWACDRTDQQNQRGKGVLALP